jgi:hypothetical protein
VCVCALIFAHLLVRIRRMVIANGAQELVDGWKNRDTRA